MRNKLVLLLILLLVSVYPAQAQTAQEIIDRFIEKTGGVEKWLALKGIKTTAIIYDHNMEIPYSRVALKDGRQILKFNLDGKEVVQMAFDGREAWNTNFISLEAEKSNNEITENLKREIKNFPNPLLHISALGYELEYTGVADDDKSTLLSIKVTLSSKLVDGNEVENVRTYFFDAKTDLLVAKESEIVSGNMRGKINRTSYSDYKMVDGLMFPFVQTDGFDGEESRKIIFSSIELNPQVSDELFKFPDTNMPKK